MDLSIVDISHTPIGGTAVGAFANSVDLARQAEEWGYSRIWFAEHHGASASNAGAAPEVLIARVAALTSRIRVGSGAVLLNHYSPFKVAETFSVLEAMSPGRIDLGLGRAGGLPALDYALQRDRREFRRVDDHAEQVSEVLAWLDEAFPADHPFAGLPLMKGVASRPQPWLLGSSPSSATLAGRLGMRYCFAGFINPRAAAIAGRQYRESFRPSGLPSNPTRPHLMLGMNVTVAPTEREAARIRATVELFYDRLRRGVFPRGPLPDPDAAVAELGGVPAASEVRPGSWPQHISGSPDQVREMLEVMADDTGADELVIQDMIIHHEDRLRSYELLATVMELTPPSSG